MRARPDLFSRRTACLLATASTCIAAVLPAVAAAHPKLPRSYAVTFLGGAQDSLGEDVNNAGQVVGVSSGQAFSWKEGALRFLGAGVATSVNDRGTTAGFTPTTGIGSFAWIAAKEHLPRPVASLGGPVNQAWAINDRGHMAGLSSLSTPPSFERRPVVWKHDSILDITARTGLVTRLGIANDINNRNAVAGSSIFTVGVERDRGFVYRRNTLTELPPLGPAGASDAQAINDRGIAVGAASLIAGSTLHATLWRGTTPHDLHTLPGGGRSQAHDINEDGLIVGIATRTPDAEAPHTGFISNGRKMLDLNELLPAGVRIAWVSAINDRGQITGSATPGGAVLLTPRR